MAVRVKSSVTRIVLCGSTSRVWYNCRMPTLPERLLTLFAMYHLRGDKILDDVDTLYASDVRFVDPFNDIQGRDHFKRILRNIQVRIKEMRFDDLEVVGDEPHFMLSWNCIIVSRVGLTLRTRGVTEFRSRDGLVTFHEDHWDALRAMAGSVPGVGAIYAKITSKLLGD